MKKPAPSDRATRPSRQAPTPSEKEIASTRTLVRVFMLLILGAFLSSNFPLPWKVLGLLFSLAALTVGILAMVSLVRQKAPALVRMSTTVGLVVALMLTIGTGAAIILWPITERYETCMTTALTSKAQRECEEDLRNLNGLLVPRSSPADQESQ